MRIADGWQQYTLLDATDGYRLEQWADVLLKRPDPQIIWKLPPKSPVWNKADAVYHRSAKGGGSWEYRRSLPPKWNLSYKELTFVVSPTGFKHTGVFPEQAANWDEYIRILKQAGRPAKVLNLFGYTGGATLACAYAGAQVTHVDASKGMVSWARENAAASNLANRPVRWIVDDCLAFVAREIRRGNQYDAIIMDPPSYGRGPTGQVWKLEENIYDLLSQTVQLLSPQPLFFTVNSYTAGLAPGVMGYMLGQMLQPRFKGSATSEEIGLPIKETKGVLPCGAAAWWRAEGI